jgi:uncharacterized protein YoxC
MAKESIMGVKTMKKIASKKGKKSISAAKPKPASGGKKNGSAALPPVRISLGSKNGELNAAVLSMTASVKEVGVALKVMSEKMAASEAMLTRKMAASEEMLTKKIAAMAERVDKTSETVDNLSETVDNLSETVDNLSETVDNLSERVDNLSETVKETSREVRQTTKNVDNLSETVKETSREMRQTTKDLAESIDKLNKNVGGINNSLGKVTELVLLPGLMENLNSQFGYQFDNISPNKIFTEGGKQYAEVDLFLENGEAVMAIEAKTRVKESEMNTFLKSLNELRQHENKAGVAGKTIYAAVAGISFDYNARKFVKANGMYLVELNHCNAMVTIEPPAGAVGKW